jgi:serine/threonine protein kinase
MYPLCHSVCLVLEICEYGSLSDVLRGGMDSGATVSRPPLNLSYSDRMYLALGCAKGLQALHAYSPTLCHRDIKSMNFLSTWPHPPDAAVVAVM